MFKLGLTGGIATGKSTVSTHFKEQPIPVLDADVIAREIVMPGEPALVEIVATFGEEMLLADGTLNRQALGSVV
ncbi:MAG: dephospho-CoA kinase, partial [Weissella cibaria]